MRRLFLAMLCIASFISAPAQAESGEPFGFRNSDSSKWNWARYKWKVVVEQVANDEKLIAICKTITPTIPACDPSSDLAQARKRFDALVVFARSFEGRARMGQVNRKINQLIAYTPDEVQYPLSVMTFVTSAGVEIEIADVWDAPNTILGGIKPRGDCEEYAILKYFVLKAAGFSSDDLRLLVVQRLANKADPSTAHAVLAVRFEGVWYILDMNNNILVEDKDALSFLQPLYVLGGTTKQVASSNN